MGGCASKPKESDIVTESAPADPPVEAKNVETEAVPEEKGEEAVAEKKEDEAEAKEEEAAKPEEVNVESTEPPKDDAPLVTL
ncbi:PREDICTED: uncharacterized protein LOC104811883 [Tarenaya hassleriana]|uniref:uncharacterized protein LOC104811883 n=1 Tax=Tarenaya hassleriana TaxID=28532 RepID=UPI00053C8B80|nr:PREDICTED: uncharacterized protein LOC104811883 [Tarenaya hassleriana]